MISVADDMLKFIDDVCEKFNEAAQDGKTLTRSRFISLCVLEYAYQMQLNEEARKQSKSTN